MTDGTESAGPGAAPVPPEERTAEFARLRALLLGREIGAIDELRARLEAMGVTAEEIAEHLPEAVALRAGRDDRLARALAPTLERAFSDSVHRHPHQIAEAIYPALGPAIRKAIAEAIAGLVANINRALEASLSVRGLRWRWEAWRSGVPYAQVVITHALVYRVEHVYLIHAETGLLLTHVHAPDLETPDADVISGMLTAIRDFVGDSGFNPEAGGGLRTFIIGDVTVLVEAGPRAVLAAVVRGQHPPTLTTRLQEILERLHFQFADPLGRFDGDAAPFSAAIPLLAECLETVVDTGRQHRRRTVPLLAWGIPALALVALVVGLFLRQRQWQRVVRALETTPGIVVLESERGWRSSRIAGLRDPLAAWPNAVVAAAGGDTTRLVATWTAYVSAESPLILARAGRALAAPPTIALRTRSDTLTAEGRAPTDWITRARTGAGLLPGVGAYDDRAVAPDFPSALRATADSLAGLRVLFPAGSAALSGSAGSTLAAVAAAWRELQDGVGPSWAVSLDLLGRTDSTGSREMNRTLSDDRARGALQRLTALGVPEQALRARGVGTSDPLPAADAGERARRNRSVSFSVRLEPASASGESRP